MLRTIGAVVAGYIALVVVIFAIFSLAYLALGPSFAFVSGTVDVTPGWMLMATFVNIGAAMLGGWTAAKIGRSQAAVKALAVLVLVLGLVSAVMVMNAAPVPLPERPLTTMEAAGFARQPIWYSFLLPVLGVAGVLFGGALARRGAASAAPAAV